MRSSLPPSARRAQPVVRAGPCTVSGVGRASFDRYFERKDSLVTEAVHRRDRARPRRTPGRDRGPAGPHPGVRP